MKKERQPEALARPEQSERAAPTGARRRRTPEEMLASLHERLPWLKPGVDRAGRTAYRSRRTRSDAANAEPAVRPWPLRQAGDGRHRRGKRNGSTSRGRSRSRHRGGAPSTADHGREQARDRHALGALLAGSALRAVAMDPGERVVADVAARQAEGSRSRPARPRGAEPSHRRSEQPSAGRVSAERHVAIEARGAAALEPCVNGNANGRQRRGLVGAAAGTEIGSRLIRCAAPSAFTAR